MQPLKPLPLSVSDFATMSDGGYAYVDNTDVIAKLADCKCPYFLSRPHGFGKTTLLSTFHELFANGTGRFKNLKLASSGFELDKPVKVLHLDWGGTGRLDDHGFNSFVRHQLKEQAEQNGIEFELGGDADITNDFHSLLFSAEPQSLVLLIDNYDAVLGPPCRPNADLAQLVRTLTDFFNLLKSQYTKFHFLMVCGMRPYRMIRSFDLYDFGKVPENAVLTGYSEENLAVCFKDYLERAAEILNQEDPDGSRFGGPFTVQKLTDRLKAEYLGWDFISLEDKFPQYFNPADILGFLNNPAAGFKHYWAETEEERGMIEVMQSFIKSRLEEAAGWKVKGDPVTPLFDPDFAVFLSSFDPTLLSDLPEGTYSWKRVMQQCGYLTFKIDEDAYNNPRSRYCKQLELANKPVKQAWLRALLELTPDVIPVCFREQFCRLQEHYQGAG